MPRLPPLIARARELWQSLAGTGAEFTPALRVTVSPLSRLCPPGWAGIVVIGDAVIATAPDRVTAQHVEQALGGLAVASLTDLAVLSGRLHIAEIRGPATLAYLDPADFRPQPAAALARPMDLGEPAFRRFLSGASPADIEESGLGEITSPAFAVREHGDVVAAAGYRDWPGRTAHLSILTAELARGRGLARAAASAAVIHAISDGKLPQWRARVPASRRIALVLGFRELGSQASISIAIPPP